MNKKAPKNKDIYDKLFDIHADVGEIKGKIEAIPEMKKTLNKHDTFVNRIQGVFIFISSGVVLYCIKEVVIYYMSRS